MISQFTIERFKCFANQSIEFANLTLLAGENATGKSTVIQALLLLRQAYLRGDLAKGELPLNGDLVSIGTIKDALYSGSTEPNSIAFSLTSLEQPHGRVFAFPIKSGELNRYILSGGDPLVDDLGELIDLSPINLFARQFSCLQAERLGPRLHYPMTELSPEEMDVGLQGEYTAHCLDEFGEEEIGNAGLAYPGTTYFSLRHQTEQWMGGIVPSLNIQSFRISEADMVRLDLQNHRPTNTGFGVSYTLPIVVAILMAKSGSMLIVENPEAHLHPAAQSELGQFLAQAAAANIQIIIETHSEHILNGIRLAVKQKVLQANNVSVQFFMRDVGDNQHQVLVPKIDSDGRIDLWPDGFFDQAEKDLMEL